MLGWLLGMKEEWRTAQGYFSGPEGSRVEGHHCTHQMHIKYYHVQSLVHETAALEGFVVQQ